MIVRISSVDEAKTVEKVLITQVCNNFFSACEFVSNTIGTWHLGSYKEYKEVRIEIGER